MMDKKQQTAPGIAWGERPERDALVAFLGDLCAYAALNAQSGKNHSEVLANVIQDLSDMVEAQVGRDADHYRLLTPRCKGWGDLWSDSDKATLYK